jgi:phenylalanyl-tRNA synthetase beta chain
LSRLEFSSSLKGEVLTVDVPTFRVDIERDVDLIEEVSRMHGFDSIESKMFATIPLFRKPSLEEKFYQLVREYLIRLGYNEIITHSLIKKKFAEMFSSKKSIRLSNPISEDLGTLRTSVLPGALQILKWNKNRKVADQQLFEIGNIFYLDNEQLDSRQETKNIALLKTGNLNKNSWVDQSRSSTIYDLKGDVVNFLNGLGKSQIQFQEQEFKFLKRNEALSIQADESEIGYMGSLSQSVLKEMDIDAEVFVAELNFEKLMKLFSWENKAQPVPKYPSIQRDLAIVVDQMIPWHKAEKIIWDQSNDLLKSIELFDLYRGKQIAPNQKSFAFTLTYQSLERTLTEKEVDTAISRVLENLKSEINAHLRT